MNGEAPENIEEAQRPELDAETALLASILLSPRDLADVAAVVSGEDFAHAGRRELWDLLVEADAAGDALDDAVTLQARVTGKPRAAKALADALVEVPMGTAVRYAGMVRDSALRRALARTAAEAARSANDRSTTAEALLDAAEARIGSLRRASGRNSVTMAESLQRVFPMLEQRYDRQTDVTGLSTGLADLDRMTAGLHPGNLVIVAGRPGMGKSGLALKFALAAAKKDEPAIVFTLEMSSDELTVRAISDEANVPGDRLKTGRFIERDWAAMARASDRLARMPLVLDDTPSPSALEMRAKARAVKAKYGKLGIVVVDYLQLAHGIGDNREQEIASLSRGLKNLAKELGCPVVALSQLNRAVEKKEGKRPTMSDLRESGAIEQDADVILFVYRDEVYDKNSNDKGVAEIIIGKQRNGPTGTVRVAFQGEHTRFADPEERREQRSFYEPPGGDE